MHISELCCKCRSINIDEVRPKPVITMLLKAMGYHSFCCKDCGFHWRKLSPMSVLLNGIYLLLALEISFLLLNYIR